MLVDPVIPTTDGLILAAMISSGETGVGTGVGVAVGAAVGAALGVGTRVGAGVDNGVVVGVGAGAASVARGVGAEVSGVTTEVGDSGAVVGSRRPCGEKGIGSGWVQAKPTTNRMAKKARDGIRLTGTLIHKTHNALEVSLGGRLEVSGPSTG